MMASAPPMTRRIRRLPSRLVAVDRENDYVEAGDDDKHADEPSARVVPLNLFGAIH